MSLAPAINGVEERLDIIIGLLQSLVSDQALAPSGETVLLEVADIPSAVISKLAKRTPPAKKQHKKRK